MKKAEQQDLFTDSIETGADFSEDKKQRYSLWRIWDKSKPLVMFIGLNPSTANETENDPTIKSVTRIAKHNGYGGFYMMNCWTYISKQPAGLPKDLTLYKADYLLEIVAKRCADVVFAWGDFQLVKESGRGEYLSVLFPNAKALHINKNGSPKHPLYCKSKTQLINYKSQV